jgi:hypothetical protein
MASNRNSDSMEHSSMTRSVERHSCASICGIFQMFLNIMSGLAVPELHPAQECSVWPDGKAAAATPVNAVISRPTQDAPGFGGSHPRIAASASGNARRSSVLPEPLAPVRKIEAPDFMMSMTQVCSALRSLNVQVAPSASPRFTFPTSVMHPMAWKSFFAAASAQPQPTAQP